VEAVVEMRRGVAEVKWFVVVCFAGVLLNHIVKVD